MQKARAEMSHWNEYDYLIVNESFDRAVEEMATIVRARGLHRDAQSHRHARLLESLGALESTPRIR
jgi:guanylate kinase